MEKNETLSLLKDKRIQWAIVLGLLFIVIYWSSSIRLSNWDLLTDQTTGEKIPLALDPFYFLRASELLLEQGSLPAVDTMRYPAAQVAFSQEIMPQATVFLYHTANIFGDYNIREINIFSPVFFFIIGMILFFFLVYALTNSKLAAIISSALLGFVPAYLYRTMAGFSDHESIGMMSLFATLLIYTLATKYITSKKRPLQAGVLGALTGFLTAFTIASWGGGAQFVFMILPVSFLLIWLTETKRDEQFATKGISFYTSWAVFTPLSGFIIGYSPSSIFRGFMLGTSGMISIFILAFILIDAFLLRWKKGRQDLKGRREIYSFSAAVVLGIIALTAIGRNVFTLIKDIWIRIFHPWGQARTGLTVAENAQPFLVDWIGQVSPTIFWVFFAGMLFIGFEATKKIKSKKRQILSMAFWIILISAVLFSRISNSSLMNGTNFISQVVYIGGVLAAGVFFIWLYFKEKNLPLSSEMAIIVSWMFFTLIAGRAAQRIFFAITPFVCFAAGYALVKTFSYLRENKDEIMRPILVVLLIVGVLATGYSLSIFEKGISGQASSTGPSANYQWQNAMSWVRDNTPEGSIFVHWWDYGFWVEYLGQRPAVTDGGHAVGPWDHLIGRYVLTTPYPETAYSFMKTHGVSYLLIDQTDLGKYPAYSKIGSDEAGSDRYSAIPVMALDPRQTQETANGTVYVFTGGMFVDEDITYTLEGKTILLPAQKAAVAGVIWEITPNDNGADFQRPVGVFLYNNQRYDVPIRYAYLDNNGLVDFGNGLDAVVRAVPSFDGSRINPIGAVVYLSPRVAPSLFAQLYLLDNAGGYYDDITLAHSEDDIVVQSLKSQGVPLNDFVYYQGLRGPIKIWKVDYPQGTLSREEFTRTSLSYAEFDNLEFVEAR